MDRATPSRPHARAHARADPLSPLLFLLPPLPHLSASPLPLTFPPHPTPPLGTAQAALISAGTTVDLAMRLTANEASSAIAVVRPPGHHAEMNVGMGFCFYNTVALAARAARARGLDRVLIVDWDVHHGRCDGGVVA